MRTYGNRADGRVWAMSEFQIHSIVIDEDVSAYYRKPWVKEAFDALRAQLQTTRALITDGTASVDDREALREAIERAEESLLQADAIRDVPLSLNAQSSSLNYYDLSGRRIPQSSTVNSLLSPGVYIQHDGKHAKKIIR